MASDQFITVEICYVTPQIQILRALQIVPGTTIGQALTESGFYTEFPELATDSLKVGIYSKLKTLETVLREHDRVEIYRPLLVDPMTARRARADKKR